MSSASLNKHHRVVMNRRLFLSSLFVMPGWTISSGCAHAQDVRPPFTQTLLGSDRRILLAFSERASEYGVRQTTAQRRGLIHDLNEANTNEYSASVQRLPDFESLHARFRAHFSSLLTEAGLVLTSTTVPQPDKLQLPLLSGLPAEAEWVLMVIGPEIGYFAGTMASPYRAIAICEVVPYNLRLKQLYAAKFVSAEGPASIAYANKQALQQALPESFQNLRALADSLAKQASAAVLAT